MGKLVFPKFIKHQDFKYAFKNKVQMIMQLYVKIDVYVEIDILNYCSLALNLKIYILCYTFCTDIYKLHIVYNTIIQQNPDDDTKHNLQQVRYTKIKLVARG